MIERHIGLILSFLPEGRFQLIQLKRHLSYYGKGLPEARECRRTIFNQCETPDETVTAFRRFWDAA